MVRTIKFLQMLLILSGIAMGTTVKAEHNESGMELMIHSQVGGGGGGNGGGDFPWPWSFAVNFPWNDVQGIWRLEKGDDVLYFSFRRIQAKRIKIKQIDIDTCDVVGIGQGLEKDKTIVSQIRNTFTNQTYNLTIYAFNEEDSPEPPILSKVRPDQVIVARIRSLDSPEPEFAAQMVRISDRLEVRCGSQEKKTKF